MQITVLVRGRVVEVYNLHVQPVGEAEYFNTEMDQFSTEFCACVMNIQVIQN